MEATGPDQSNHLNSGHAPQGGGPLGPLHEVLNLSMAENHPGVVAHVRKVWEDAQAEVLGSITPLRGFVGNPCKPG